MSQKGFITPLLILILVGIIGGAYIFLKGPLPKIEPYTPKPLAQLPNKETFPDLKDIDEALLSPGIASKIFYTFEGSMYSYDTSSKEIKTVVKAEPIDGLGMVGISQDKNRVYYSTQQGNIEKVFRKDLKTDEIVSIFQFPIEYKHKEFFGSNVKISPDEKHLAYSYKDGLAMYTLESRTVKKLFTYEPCENSRFGCESYFFPQWSANGKYLSYMTFFYEGGSQGIIDPFTGVVNKNNLGGWESIWSDQGNQLAILGAGIGRGGLIEIVNSPLTGKGEPILSKFKDLANSYVRSGDWSSDGKIVFTFTNDNGSDGIGIYDTQDQSYFTYAWVEREDYGDDIKWLPSGKVLFYQEQDGDLWLLGVQTRGKVKLPFKADRILAVL